MIDLVSRAVGGRIVDCNDEFFAPASNLIDPGPPISNDEYTEQGKWMDGWETRRRREPGHDWCVVALGVPGRVRRVVVDTSFFTGNYPESFSLEGCDLASDLDPACAEWEELIPKSDLEGDSTAEFEVGSPHRFTHLRLNIFPDGGVARLRVEGEPIPARDLVCGDQPIDLLSHLVGGTAVKASDVHYSSPSNLLRHTEPAGMWDGWETRRRRGPGNDWVELRLGLPGVVGSVVVDTRHFKGNAPGWVSVSVSEDGADWLPVLDRIPVRPDEVAELGFEAPLHASLLRVDIHPDGGLARVRALGTPDPEASTALRLGYLDALTTSASRRFFAAACSAGRWVDLMAAGRPYATASEVHAAAERAFDSLDEGDWLEAFGGHARIGETGDATSNREQAGAAAAGEETRAGLAEANAEYEGRFGFPFIVYATGKSGEEMLELARSRLESTRDAELVAAAGEQRKITDTRLRLMLCEGGTT